MRLALGITSPKTGKVSRAAIGTLLTSKTRFQRPLVTLAIHHKTLCSLMGMTSTQGKNVRDEVLQLLGATEKLNDRLIDLSPLLLAQINYFTGIASPAPILVSDGSYLRDHAEFQQAHLKNKTVLWITNKPKCDESIFDQWWVLDKGNLIEFPTAEASAAYWEQNLDLYGGDPQALATDDEEDDEIEAEELVTMATPPPPPPSEIAISRIYPESELRTAKPATFIVDFEKLNELRTPLKVGVAMSFFDQKNIRIFSTWSHSQGFVVDRAKGSFRLQVPSFPLLPGTYSFKAAIVDAEGKALARAYSTENFEVGGSEVTLQDGEPAPTVGNIWIRHEWSISDNSGEHHAE